MGDQIMHEKHGWVLPTHNKDDYFDHFLKKKVLAQEIKSQKLLMKKQKYENPKVPKKIIAAQQTR